MMRKQIEKIYSNPLFSGSLVMLIGTNSANFLAYVYHLFFGRLLGPSHYGELASILSLIGLLTSLFSFFSVVIVKFSSTEDSDGANRFYSWLYKIVIRVAVIVSLILLIASPVIAKSLSTSILSAALIGPTMFFTFFIIIYSSFLQGLLRFNKLILVNISSWGARLILGYLLYLAGLSLFGVVFGIFVSSLISAYLGRRFSKLKVLGGVINYNKGKEILKYSLPVFIVTLTTGFFIALDVVFARHYLSVEQSGYYAALSTLGKIIVYAAVPITGVMFPLVSKRSSKNQGTLKVLMLSMLMTLFVGGSIAFVYWLFPNIAVGLLYGSKYLVISPMLSYFGMVYLIYSVDLLLANYFLSKKRTTPAYFMFLGIICEFVGIIFFHDSISSIIHVSAVSVTFILVLLFFFLFKEYKREF